MTGPPCIVCVDDDLALLETLRQQITDLHGQTHEVFIATNGEQALSMIYDLHQRGRIVEVVIADLIMPGMTGDRLLEDLQLTLSSMLRQFQLKSDNSRLVRDLQSRNQELGSTLKDLRQAKERIEDNFVGMLQSLANALEAKDAYTAGHSERVARWAVMISRKIGLSVAEIDHIRAVALLHDIGKIGMPERILNKPGALTEAEWALVKTHPVTGAQILQPLRSFHDYIPIVRHHHEWFNGRGYPDQVGGSELPIVVWIAATADAFDAMTSNRPYRGMQTLDFAFHQLSRGSGSQFNPECVKACMDLLREPASSTENLLKAAAAGNAGSCAIPREDEGQERGPR